MVMEKRKKGIVSTKQIYFRPLEREDVDRGWLDWVNDPELNRFIAHKRPMAKEDLLLYYEQSKPPEAYMFAVCLTENDRYIGNARLSLIDWVDRRAAHGRLTGAKDLRGRNIGTEILVLLAYYAFYNLNLNRLASAAVVKNIASVKSNVNAGFTEEGIAKQHFYINGQYEDCVYLGLNKDEFDLKKWKDTILQN
jgi:RimJ/RimL family protein N-acetyltransferase